VAHGKSAHQKTKDHNCNSSALNANLKRHLKAVHERIKENKRTQWDFASPQKQNLVNHVKSVHGKYRLKAPKRRGKGN
jgi:hypothetical protein